MQGASKKLTLLVLGHSRKCRYAICDFLKATLGGYLCSLLNVFGFSTPEMFGVSNFFILEDFWALFYYASEIMYMGCVLQKFPTRFCFCLLCTRLNL